jgi:Flp pilus assembly protein TadD
MSLLADLLSKVAPKNVESGVPPTLQRVVLDSKRKMLIRRRMVVIGSVAVALVLAGVVVARYIDRIKGSPRPSPSVSTNMSPSQGQQAEPVQEGIPEPRTGKTLPQEARRAQEDGSSRQRAAGETLPPKAAPRGEDPSAAKPATPRAVEPERGETRQEAEKAGNPVSVRQQGEKDEALYAARNYEMAKDYDQALRYYKKALDVDRRNYVLMSNIASVLIAQGSFKDAADYARAALTLNKEHVPSLVNLGISSIQLGIVDDGSSHLRKALSLEPTNRYALLNLALLYEREKDYDQAQKTYFRLSELKDVQGHLGVARIAEKTGRTDDARQAYREVLAMDNVDEGSKKLAMERLLTFDSRN